MFLFLACGVLIVAILYFGRGVLIPVALAVFFSFLLAPVVYWLERCRIPRVPSVIIVVLTITAISGGLGWVLFRQASQVAADVHLYRHNIVSKSKGLRDSLGGLFRNASDAVEFLEGGRDKSAAEAPESGPAREGAATNQPAPRGEEGRTRPESSEAADSTKAAPEATEEKTEPVRVEVVSPTGDLLALLGRSVGSVVNPLAMAGATIVFIIFFLLYREDLRDRVIRLSGRARINITTTALVDCGKHVSQYIVAQAIANSVIGVAVGIGLFAMGIPNAVLWGLLSALLRFIPYVGPLVAAIFPTLQALALFEGWYHPIAVVALIVIVDQLSANFLEPWLFGARTGASPTAILFSFVFWTWLWGGIGLFLATPITVCLIVLGKYIPAFAIFSILLGDEEALEPDDQLYQRLLANDGPEVIRNLRRLVEETSLIETCDQVILPALTKLEHDRRNGLLEADRVESARKTVEQFLDEVQPAGAPSKEDVSDDFAKPLPLFVVVLDRGGFDDLIPRMLAQSGCGDCWRLHVLSKATLSTEAVDQIREMNPAAVLLAAIEPRDFGRMRHVSTRLAVAGLANPVHVFAFFRSKRSLLARRRSPFSTAVNVHSTFAELVDALCVTAALSNQPSPNSKAPPARVAAVRS